MLNVADLGKPINTCLSAGTDIQNEPLSKAKEYLTKNYNNRYNLLPHLTYMICPFPEYNLEKAKVDISDYFLNKKPFVFNLSELHFEPKKKFYSIPVIGSEVKNLHEDLVHLFNKYRDGHVRKKDIARIQAGEREPKEIELIRKWGYFRIFDNFTPHITVGNVEADDKEIPLITKKLQEMLKDVLGKTITINQIHIAFHTDSEIQTEMKELWGKDYSL